MMKRTLKTALTVMTTIALAMPTMVYADDLAADYVGNNSEAVDTNNGYVEENSGSITDNEGEISRNNGEVSVNNGTINNNTGTVGTNSETGYINFVNANGSVGVNNAGTYENHDDAGIGILAGLNTTLTTNNGFVMDNMGTIVTNSSTGYVEENSRNASNEQGGTIENNAGTVRVNNASCTIDNNTGTVDYNGGVVVNSDGGVVQVNRGGEVRGSGTVNINLSNADKVEEGVNVINQMWELISNVWGHLTPNATEAPETTGIGDIYKENQYSVTQQLRVWLSTTGEVIIAPTDANRQIRSLTATNGGATVERLADGTYRISNITKDVNLAVSFEGDQVAAAASNNAVAQGNNGENKTETTSAATPATAPSAPVVTAGALFGAVDANGMIIAADILPTDDHNSIKEHIDFVNNAMTMIGVDLTGKEIVTMYSGKMSNVSAGSMMTIRTYTNPAKGEIMVAVFRDPATGLLTYANVLVNADGTVSFTVPFANCEFSLVNIQEEKQDTKQK